MKGLLWPIQEAFFVHEPPSKSGIQPVYCYSLTITAEGRKDFPLSIPPQSVSTLSSLALISRVTVNLSNAEAAKRKGAEITTKLSLCINLPLHFHKCYEEYFSAD